MNNIAGIYRRSVVMQTEQQEEALHKEEPKYLTCAQWIAKYGWPSMGGLRWIIFRAKNEPELRKIFIRFRRRILLKEQEVLRYLEKMNERDLNGGSKI
jgi:hypothetical protein